MSSDRKKRAEQMRKEREKAEKRQRNIITVAIVAIVVVLVVGGAWAIKTTSDANKKNENLVAPKNATKDFGVVVDAEALGGEPAAEDAEPVEVELYEDFQCPACRSFEQLTGAFLKQAVQAGDVTITYRPFSFLDSQSLNEYSSRATNVALCVLDSGGAADFAKIHDYLFANQPDEGTAGPENAALINAAKDLGITGIDSCVKTERFGPWIEDAREAGQDRGVSGTPSVWVDDKQLEDPSIQGIQKAIADAKSA